MDKLKIAVPAGPGGEPPPQLDPECQKPPPGFVQVWALPGVERQSSDRQVIVLRHGLSNPAFSRRRFALDAKVLVVMVGYPSTR